MPVAAPTVRMWRLVRYDMSRVLTTEVQWNVGPVMMQQSAEGVPAYTELMQGGSHLRQWPEVVCGNILCPVSLRQPRHGFVSVLGVIWCWLAKVSVFKRNQRSEENDRDGYMAPADAGRLKDPLSQLVLAGQHGWRP